MPSGGENSSTSECTRTPRGSAAERKVSRMNRNCDWISGPRRADMKISAAKWWFAISRDVFAKDQRRRMWNGRPAVHCQRTPKFISPLARKL